MSVTGVGAALQPDRRCHLRAGIAMFLDGDALAACVVEGRREIATPFVNVIVSAVVLVSTVLFSIGTRSHGAEAYFSSRAKRCPVVLRDQERRLLGPGILGRGDRLENCHHRRYSCLAALRSDDGDHFAITLRPSCLAARVSTKDRKLSLGHGQAVAGG